MTEKSSPFWKNTPLEEMTRDQWESLCDGCGRCCLEKLEDADTGEVCTTYVSCRHLDTDLCRCRVYEKRLETVSECLFLTPETLAEMKWLPETCAYRCVAEGRGLEWWHPLVCKDSQAIHEAGISVRGKTVSGQYVHPDDLEGYIV
jgi:uncharacterized protein